MSSQPLKLGMVGGGRGAFIGAVHRAAANLDQSFTLVAGALSSDPQRALESARDLGLPADRSYRSWRDMLQGESARLRGDRIDAVAIVTPNDSHFEIASGFAAQGFHLILDKPMTTTLADARALVKIVERAGVECLVTYTYAGYPMVRQAAAMVRAGELGAIRKVVVEYHQGWLATNLESSGQKQASWRVDPARAGAGGAIGDIGTHAEHLMSTITGQTIASLCADLTSFVPGRKLDDDAGILVRLSGGARGIISVSQVCVGEHNNLTVRVYGEKGSLRWAQETPERLEHLTPEGITRTLFRGGGGVGAEARLVTRVPSGHPEGYIEAMANLYRGIARRIASRHAAAGDEIAFPGVRDGARGVAFVELAARSTRGGGVWVDAASLDGA